MFLKQTYFILVKCYAITFVLLIPFFLAAQSHSATISHFTTDNGLPQNSIKDIETDNNGYFWLATELGVCRFDGANFKLFTPTVNNAFRTSFLGTDNKNKVYAYYDYEDKYQFCIDSNNNVTFKNCFSADNFGKDGCVFDKRWLSNLFKTNKTSMFGLPEDKTSIGIGAHEVYLLSGHPKPGYQIIYCKNDEIKVNNMPQTLRHVTILDSGLIVWDEIKNTYSFLNGGNIIIANASIKGDLVNEPFNKNSVQKLMSCKGGTFIYRNNKIFKISLINNSISSELIFDNLPFKDALCINYSEALKKYLVGTSTDGLYILSKPTFNVLKLPATESGTNIFYAQQLINNKLFANGYLLSADEHEAPQKIFSDFSPFNLSTDKKGQLVFCSYQDYTMNIRKYDFEKKQLTIIPTKQKENIKLITYNQFDSLIYFSTGTFLGKINDTNVIQIPIAPEIKFINTLCFINKDSVFIGTKKGLFTYCFSANKYSKLIAEGDFRTIYKDRLFNYWCGTYASGFYVVNKTGIVKLPPDYSNRLKGVHAFYQDKQNRLWMSTNNGIITANINDLLAYKPEINNGVFYNIFDKSDGLSTNEFNGGCSPSSVYFNNGILSLPSMDGIVQFSPDDIVLSAFPQQVYIDNIICNSAPFNYTDKILFPKESKQISFMISYPYYGKKDEIVVQYLLNGNGDRWFDAANNNITFSELPHGDYILQLKIKGSNRILKTITFSIAPHFYQTLWFYLLVFSGILMAAYLFYKRRLNYIEEKNKALEKTVADKTKELNKIIVDLDESVDKLETSESELNSLVVIQNKILNLVLHDLKSPLQFLKNISVDLNKFYKEKNEPATKSSIDALTKGIEEIHNFSTTFFEWIYFQRKGIKPVKENISLSSIFTELDILFKSITVNNNIIFNPTAIELITDKNILTTILRNIIDNSNKNTTAGTVTIDARKNRDEIIISITDSGQGFPQPKLDLLNSIINKNESADKLSGFGYKIIVELTTLLQAKLNIINLDKGAKVELTIYT